MSHQIGVFTNPYSKNINKGDDEYWKNYIDSIRGKEEDVDDYAVIEEDYAITVSRVGKHDERVSIELNRKDALALYEGLSSCEPYSVAESVRVLLNEFFVENRNTCSEDFYY